MGRVQQDTTENNSDGTKDKRPTGRTEMDIYLAKFSHQRFSSYTTST